MSKKVALISGITGQDGSFLAEFLIEKGYEVHGILRRSSSFNTARIEHLYLDEWVRDMKQNRLVNLHWGDMTDSSSLIRIIQSVQPDEIYNLAAQSHVKVSFDVPEYTAEGGCGRYAAHAGGGTYIGAGKENQDLSGIYFGTFRTGAGSSSERDYSFLSPFSIRSSQAIWFLDNQELPRKLWHVCRKRYFVQSRK